MTMVFIATVATVAGLSRGIGGEERPPQDVSITVLADGAHCAVQKVRLHCDDAIVHLRTVLKLPAGARVRLKAHRAAPYQSVKSVMNMLNSSEYPLPAARR